jgi:aspartate/glutamate racemase
MNDGARIALIHAVAVAMEPVRQEFARLWPEAKCCNLLDDSLSTDRAGETDLTPAMTERICALAAYAEQTGAEGILFTCSAFGEAIEKAAANARIPVLKPNEAMFEKVLAAGNNVGMLATFQPSVAGMEEEFRALADQQQKPAARLRTICVPEAMAALRQGDAETHNRLLAEAAPQLRDCDAVMLAQFSTAQAERLVTQVLGPVVHNSPGAAVAKLKQLLEKGS